jgi:hypothetical protein
MVKRSDGKAPPQRSPFAPAAGPVQTTTSRFTRMDAGTAAGSAGGG